MARDKSLIKTNPGRDNLRTLKRLNKVCLVFLSINMLTACSHTPKEEAACEAGSTNLLSERIVHTYGATSSGNAEHGKNLFMSLCANCHAEQGVKAINKSIRSKIDQPKPPKLACNQIQQNLSEAYLFATIKHGKTASDQDTPSHIKAHSMPAWKELLSDEEIIDLVAYLLSIAQQGESH